MPPFIARLNGASLQPGHHAEERLPAKAAAIGANAVMSYSRLNAHIHLQKLKSHKIASIPQWIISKRMNLANRIQPAAARLQVLCISYKSTGLNIVSYG